MKITQQTQDWGNSTGIRLPKKILQAAKWDYNQQVDIENIGKNIVLKPIKSTSSKKESLNKLLKQITDKNIHKHVNWDESVGKEIW